MERMLRYETIDYISFSEAHSDDFMRNTLTYSGRSSHRLLISKNE